jgi:hypothetical protein
MKFIFKIAAASLGLAAIAAVATPAFAGPARVELSIGNGYYQPQTYVQPEVIYEAPAPVYRYRYRDDDGWRQQQWREREWRERERREHYWRERNEWRERQWQGQRGRDHDEHDDHQEHDHRGDWR